MKIVIKIPEKCYNDIRNSKTASNYSVLSVLDGIRNGTILPKGHGRLIEVNKLLHMTKSYKSELGGLKADPFVKCGIETVESFIKELPTIIEADKAESEG